MGGVGVNSGVQSTDFPFAWQPANAKVIKMIMECLNTLNSNKMIMECLDTLNSNKMIMECLNTLRR